MYHLVDCECPEGLEGACEACQQETLERGIESAMLRAEREEEEGQD
jgi:hypothetical protein